MRDDCLGGAAEPEAERLPAAQLSLLDQIDKPADLRRMARTDLDALAKELRTELLSTVSKTGGHLGAGLGVIELTIALHYVFATPMDRLVWDVSHQCYPHKILTGRRKDMAQLRQRGGPSGFTNRQESQFDPFGAAHSSTAISAGLGLATARDLTRADYHVVSVVGDGAMSGGLAMEGLNNVGAQRRRQIIVLNDNDMSISPPSGALAGHLTSLRAQMPDRMTRRKAMAQRALLSRVMENCPLSVTRNCPVLG